MVATDELDRSTPEAFCRSVAQKAAGSVGCSFRDVLKRHKSRAYLLARLRKEFPKPKYSDEQLRAVIDDLRKESRDAAAELAGTPDDLEPEQEWNPHEPQRGREARASDVWPYRARQLEAVLEQPLDMPGVLELAKQKLGWERNWTIQCITAGEDAGVFGYVGERWMKPKPIPTGVLGIALRPDGLTLCVLRKDWVEKGGDWMRVALTQFDAPAGATTREQIERLHRLAWRACDYADAQKVEHVFLESYPYRAAGIEELAELGGVLRRDFALRLGKWPETAPARDAARLVVGQAPAAGAHDAIRKLGALFSADEARAWLVANYGLKRAGFRAVSAAAVSGKGARK